MSITLTKGASVLHTLKRSVVVVIALMLAACASSPKRANDLYANSVKVTNLKANHGGTGIVLRSSDTSSLVLTNSHVCGVVENGGLVSGRAGQFQVTEYKRSEAHDLCLIKVAGNLGYNTVIAQRPPELQYESAFISGHPALYPNVITKGHFSGRDSIQILVDIRKCTEEEAADDQKGLACAMLGGIPIIKSFEAILVTATIMPGSSGSGVYNRDGELTGVAFAGGGDLGYAWTVPYEAVQNFLHKEARTLKYKRPDNVVDLFGEKSKSRVDSFMVKLKKACSTPDREKIKGLCALADQDIIY